MTSINNKYDIYLLFIFPSIINIDTITNNIDITKWKGLDHHQFPYKFFFNLYIINTLIIIVKYGIQYLSLYVYANLANNNLTIIHIQ